MILRTLYPDIAACFLLYTRYIGPDMDTYVPEAQNMRHYAQLFSFGPNVYTAIDVRYIDVITGKGVISRYGVNMLT